MSSEQQLLPVPVPLLGVHAEFDAFRLPAEACASAANMISIDGTMRPRPAFTKLAMTAEWTRGLMDTPGLMAVHGMDLARSETWRFIGIYDPSGTPAVVRSQDGRTWEGDTITTTANRFGAMLFNEKHHHWMVVDWLGYVFRLISGTDWGASLNRICTPTDSIIGMAHDLVDGYVLVAMVEGANYRLRFTPDPTASPPVWSEVAWNLVTIKNALAFGNDYWIVVCDNGAIYRAASTGALVAGHWVSRGPNIAGLSFKCVGYSRGNTWLAAGRSSRDAVVYRSTDNGEHWFLCKTFAAIESDPVSLGYRGNGEWMLNFATGATYGSLDDGGTWVSVANLGRSAYQLIHTGMRHWLAACHGGGLYLLPSSCAPTALQQYDAELEEHCIVIATDGGWLHLDQTDDHLHDLTPIMGALTGTTLAPTVFRTFEKGPVTLLLGTNGVDRPKVWDGSAGCYRDMADGNAPAAKCMAVAANRVLLGHLTNGPNAGSTTVDVSAFNNPDAGWGVTQVSLLGDSPGALVAMAELSALEVALFKEDAIVHAIATDQFMGVAVPFRFQTQVVGISGPCSPCGLARMPDGTIVYLGNDGGMYLYDGQRPRDLGLYFRRLFQPLLEENRLEEVVLCLDPTTKLLWVWYPNALTGRSNGVVIATDQPMPWPAWPVALPAAWEAAVAAPVFVRSDVTIGDLSLPLGSYDTSIGEWSTLDWMMLLGLEDGTFYREKWADDGDYSDGGIPISVAWRTGYSPLTEDPTAWKTVHEIHSFVDNLIAGESLAVSLYGADAIGGTETFTAAVSSSTVHRKISPRMTSRFFSLGLAASIRRLFTWRGGALFMSPRGRR